MMKIIHIVSGDKNSGAFKGAYLLHKGLINQGINYVFKNSKKLGKFARKNYLKKYHPEKITKNYINLYNSILKKNELNQ